MRMTMLAILFVMTFGLGCSTDQPVLDSDGPRSQTLPDGNSTEIHQTPFGDYYIENGAAQEVRRN
jgi:hypothetical protein